MDGLEITLLEIESAAFSANPCEVSQQITITVMVKEVTKILSPEVWYSGEIYANEV